MHADGPKILISIFHKQGKDDANFEKLKWHFKEFDLFIPEVEFYGNKWWEAKKYFTEKEYDSLFVICSDVSIICGNIITKIKEHAADKSIGAYGFGTVHNCTFNWQRYSSLQLIKHVPFAEGYCFGANAALFKHLELDTVLGYGIDLEIGYKANANGLKCIIDSNVCIKHEYGKSYNVNDATKEYHQFLNENPDILRYISAFSE